MLVTAKKLPVAGRGYGQNPPPLDQSIITDPTRYQRWRTQKLARVGRYLEAPFVEIQDPARLEAKELSALGERINAMNFALYRTDTATDNAAFGHHTLTGLCRQAGFGLPAVNPFAHSSGVSEIRVADDARQRAYIPYGNRALNWHTDGYYNPPAERINGFAMHTIRAAAEGGENRFLDHEVLYLLLRDRDPALAACLFAADVMTIPPGIQAGGAARAAHTGPVFSIAGTDGTGGRLQMDFTLRKRHIHWKESRQVRAALAEIRAILDDPDNPHVLTHRFAAGEGVLSNNVLHNRAAFTDAAGSRGRLVLRARYYDRIGDTGIQPGG